MDDSLAMALARDFVESPFTNARDSATYGHLSQRFAGGYVRLKHLAERGGR